jgi:hypothetical protein
MAPQIHTHVVRSTATSLRIGTVLLHAICRMHGQLNPLSGSPTAVSDLAMVMDALVSMVLPRQGLALIQPFTFKLLLLLFADTLSMK